MDIKINEMETLAYTGNYLREKNNPLKLEIYDPAPDLVEAVNLAIYLEQPLLLMGEPGCGKTRLAESVAAELHKEKFRDHYFRWDIKSNSRAKDGIYQYDALKRMYDANSGNADAKKVSNYIKQGRFAEALIMPQNGDIPNILLIDEIDKADIDFPNDLLLEIEKREFEIPELGNEKFQRKSNVIIFITSNRERELPPAFLRRCLYHFINFPKQDKLIDIINAKYDKKNGDEFVSNAVQLFLDIRTKLEGQFSENEKKPATSELLEWFNVIDHCLNSQNGNQALNDSKAFVEGVKNYKKGDIDNVNIPFPQVLLKTWESSHMFQTKLK